MSSHFIVTSTDEGFDVLGRDLFPEVELIARRANMLKNGWKATEVDAELAMMSGWRQLNKRPVNNVKVVNEYLFHFVTPGDYIDYCGQMLYVQNIGVA